MFHFGIFKFAIEMDSRAQFTKQMKNKNYKWNQLGFVRSMFSSVVTIEPMAMTANILSWPKCERHNAIENIHSTESIVFGGNSTSNLSRYNKCPEWIEASPLKQYTLTLSHAVVFHLAVRNPWIVIQISCVFVFAVCVKLCALIVVVIKRAIFR